MKSYHKHVKHEELDQEALVERYSPSIGFVGVSYNQGTLTSQDFPEAFQ